MPATLSVPDPVSRGLEKPEFEEYISEKVFSKRIDLKVLFVNIKYFFLSKVFEVGTKCVTEVVSTP